MEEQSLSPFVYWAQTDKEISLKIDLRNVESPEVDVQDHTVAFRGVGSGARGRHPYAFSLQLLYAVNPDETSQKVTGRHIELKIAKQEVKFWERLLYEKAKPSWLKIDFDKWAHPCDAGEESRSITEDYPGLYDAMAAQETGGVRRRDSLQKVYLLAYNMFVFVGFLYISAVLCVRYASMGEAGLAGSYGAVGWMVKAVFLTQFLEVLHPLVGLTRGGLLEAVLQICGRATIFFCLIESEARMQPKPVVFWLLLVWSAVEVFRYPYYLARLCGASAPLLTWLRYTVWMPLYPLGFLLEGVVILRSIPYTEETGAFSLALPNRLNLAFHFPSFLRLYLLLFFFPVMYKMMLHMHHQRLKKLQGDKKQR